MNCTYHIQNPAILICMVPHKCECQRKLCVECLDEHNVDARHTLTLKKFQEMALKNLKDSKLDETSEFTRQRKDFKSLLSQTEQMLKKIWEEFSQSIKQVYDWIEMENQTFIRPINLNVNLAESSYTDLEKLVYIVQGTILNKWNADKNFQMELKKTNYWGDNPIKTFIEKSKEGIQLLSRIQPGYEQKEDLYDILNQTKDMDTSIFSLITKMLDKQKISDSLEVLSKNDNQELYYKYIKTEKNQYQVNRKIKCFKYLMYNIYQHDFNISLYLIINLYNVDRMHFNYWQNEN
ncbi:unnamed protein product [Paramecium pentaurelia]|uniref:Uncharacterized protein n=1 Tax=Paramecium pentaurelia TaxID=43138 RepID=A0A8S1YQ24_9CILI|nr:unnamed protein product [Paramecium pentaurelia]